MGKAERVALQVIGAVALIGVLAIAPGMGLVLKRLGVHKKFGTSYTPTLLGRLKQKGYITFEIRGGKKFARITELGKKRLREQQQRLLQASKRWDRKWRIVTFDIPERYRHVRDQVRYELREAGFVQLHKSVWITPHPCEEFIALLKADQHIGKNLLYIVAEHVEYSDRLEKIFKVSDSHTTFDRE